MCYKSNTRYLGLALTYLIYLASDSAVPRICKIQCSQAHTVRPMLYTLLLLVGNLPPTVHQPTFCGSAAYLWGAHFYQPGGCIRTTRLKEVSPQKKVADPEEVG